MTIAVTCVGNGTTLPALAIFKGKRKLKFRAPQQVQVTVQKKGWMDTELMIQWFRHIILPYTKGRRALLVVDSFSAHETEEFIDVVHKNNVDLAIIPGGCTSKIQPLDVCINKPLKAVVKKEWIEYVHSIVDTQVQPTPQDKLKSPDKALVVDWINSGIEYLQSNPDMVKKSFLVCGITNAIDGRENELIRCARELPQIQIPYIDEDDEDPFLQDDVEAGSESDDNGDCEDGSEGDCDDEEGSDEECYLL